MSRTLKINNKFDSHTILPFTQYKYYDTENYSINVLMQPGIISKLSYILQAYLYRINCICMTYNIIQLHVYWKRCFFFSQLIFFVMSQPFAWYPVSASIFFFFNIWEIMSFLLHTNNVLWLSAANVCVITTSAIGKVAGNNCWIFINWITLFVILKVTTNA